MNTFRKHLFLTPFLVLLCILIFQVDAYAVRTIYHKTALTGGGSDSLDGINGALLLNNDAAFVMVGGVSYGYLLDSDSAAAESSPDIIAPNDNPGDKRWILQSYYGTGGAGGDVATDTLWDAAGDLVQGTGADTSAKLTKGAEGTILRAGAASNAYSTSTFADTYAKGTFLYNAAANTVASLAHPGAANYILYTNAVDTAAWIASSANMISLLGSADYATARTNLGVAIGTNVQAYSATLLSLAGLTETFGGIPYGTADNAYAWLGAGATGKVMIAKGAAAPEWTPYTFPATVPTVGKVLISDGTNLIGSTALGSGAYATVSGTNTGDETAQRIGTLINGLDAKTEPADADYFGLMDSETGNILKKFSYAYMKSLLWGSPTLTGMPSISAGAGNGGGVLKLLEDPNNGTDYSSVTGAADAGTYPSWTWGGSQGAEAFTMTLGNNSVTYSSSTGITSISFGAINLVTTGTISGAMPTVADADAHTITSAEAYGYVGWATGAGQWDLPAAVAGMSITIYSTTAAAIVINPDNADYIVLNGTALSVGDSITSASGAGDFISLVAKDGDYWYTMGRSGTWTDTN